MIGSQIKDKNFKYIFIDEIQNVKGFESVVEAYRNEENYSIFITGSNSYLLSGELITKLTGRKIEIEMLPLNFYEYIDMKKFYQKELKANINEEFELYIREGGFPGTIKYDNEVDKRTYVQNVLNDILKKDIKVNEKIKSLELFNNIQKFVVNNFGTMISVGSIKSYYESIKINIDP